MTQLEFARINNNLYKHLNDFCRLMPCVKCPFYNKEDKCLMEQSRDILQTFVFDKNKTEPVPTRTSDRLDELENRVGRLEELVEFLQKGQKA